MTLITPDLSGIVNGNAAQASAWVNPFNSITNDYNGGIDNNNISLNANINPLKIDNTNNMLAFPGLVVMYGAATAPTGWLLCNGTAVSRTTYAALFAVVGTSYGTGDGSTTFNLPNSMGRVAIGAGAGSGLTSRAVGATGGEENHTLTVAELAVHTHIQDSHAHGINTWNNSGGGGSAKPYMPAAGDPSSYSTNAATATNQNAGSGSAHNNIQPFFTPTYIIKT